MTDRSPTYRSFAYGHADPLPAPADAEVRTPDALVEALLTEFSDPGDRVLDPFAGFGTTLAVAEALGRVPVGIESDPDRVEHVRGRLATPARVRQGDVLTADLSWIPPCECCLTSPPFMERTADRNPFRNDAGEGTYGAYLDDVETAFGRLRGALAAGGRVLVHVANLKHEGRVTPLAWDVARRIGAVLRFDGETVVTWTGAGNPDAGDGSFGYGYDHTYCLVFTVPGGRDGRADRAGDP